MDSRNQDSREDSAAELVSGGMVRVREAAEFAGVARSTLYQWMDSGILPFVRVGRTRRIPRRALIALASRNLCGGEALDHGRDA